MSVPQGPGAPVPVVVGVVDVFVVRGGGASRRFLALRRAPGTRSAGGWEAVHGSIEPGELPHDAAWREVIEETGLTPRRLYSITTNPFYLARTATVQLAIVFCAVVADDAEPVLDVEHDAARWCTPDEARRTYLWPREREMVAHVEQLIGPDGTAGVNEDVIRVR